MVQGVIATTQCPTVLCWEAQQPCFAVFERVHPSHPGGAAPLWRQLGVARLNGSGLARGFSVVQRTQGGKIRRLTMRMGAPQPVNSSCGRGVAGLIGLIGCLNTRNRNSAISRLQFGCKKPKLRALRKPLGSTCCMSSHKKVAPLTVRTIVLLVLLSRQR